jgi:hypothetical protein
MVSLVSVADERRCRQVLMAVAAEMSAAMPSEMMATLYGMYSFRQAYFDSLLTIHRYLCALDFASLKVREKSLFKTCQQCNLTFT